MLPKEQWLRLAKGLCVGQTARHRHLGERRPNLIVGNDSGKYWAYCQACKEGGVEMKEHVKLTGVQAPKKSTDLSMPSDMIPIEDCDDTTQANIAAFLVRKNMDAQYLPKLFFTAERKRLMLQTENGWLGRDLTERSNQKWVTFNRSTFIRPLGRMLHTHAVIVEDPFSYYKVSWACRDMPVQVWSSLGTRVTQDMVASMVLAHEVKSIHIFYDGDVAGYAGANVVAKTMKLWMPVQAACAPAGLDPKDMNVLSIQLAVAAISGLF